MNAVPFDTLRLARRLETAGLEPSVAAGAADALADAMTTSDLATKSELLAMKNELKADIAGLRAEMQGEFVAVRAETAGLRAEMRHSNDLLRRDMTIKLGSMLMVAVGVILAVMRFMPRP